LLKQIENLEKRLEDRNGEIKGCNHKNKMLIAELKEAKKQKNLIKPEDVEHYKTQITHLNNAIKKHIGEKKDLAKKLSNVENQLKLKSGETIELEKKLKGKEKNDKEKEKNEVRDLIFQTEKL